MYSHVRKIGTTGRYGTRMGRRLRDIVSKLEDESKNRCCPSCKSTRVKREAAGIWKCKSCCARFTGGAHIQLPGSRGE